MSSLREVDASVEPCDDLVLRLNRSRNDVTTSVDRVDAPCRPVREQEDDGLLGV